MYFLINSIGVLPPGEYNPDAYLGANLCFDYINKGMYMISNIEVSFIAVNVS